MARIREAVEKALTTFRTWVDGAVFTSLTTQMRGSIRTTLTGPSGEGWRKPLSDTIGNPAFTNHDFAIPVRRRVLLEHPAIFECVVTLFTCSTLGFELLPHIGLLSLDCCCRPAHLFAFFTFPLLA